MLTSTETSGDLAISTREAQNLSGQTQNNQNDQTDTQNLSPLQQRKRDALELAELIYKIYNDNCPALTDKAVRGENENV